MGFLLLLPFLFIRFGLLALLGKGAVARAAYFAPLIGKEKAAYWIYQASNAAIFLYLFFLKITAAPAPLFYTGAVVYATGLILLVVSVINFASPSESGINQNGLYRLSRNPMYVSYFVYFAGCVLLTRSRLLAALVLLFQLSEHWIILAEERWCREQFGAPYEAYRKRVRRYL